MTGRATHAFIDMNRVIEISEVRQVVHPHPLQRLARLETGAHRFEIRAVGPNLLVTVHADRGRGHARRSRRLNRRMTIPAIDAVVAHVVFVTELNRLLTLDVGARVPTRTVDLRSDEQRRGQNKSRAEDSRAGKIVRTVTENLWHLPQILKGGLLPLSSQKAGGGFVLQRTTEKFYCLVRVL